MFITIHVTIYKETMQRFFFFSIWNWYILVFISNKKITYYKHHSSYRKCLILVYLGENAHYSIFFVRYLFFFYLRIAGIVFKFYMELKHIIKKRRFLHLSQREINLKFQNNYFPFLLVEYIYCIFLNTFICTHFYFLCKSTILRYYIPF